MSEIKIGDKVRMVNTSRFYEGMVVGEEETYRGRYLTVKENDDGLPISLPEGSFEKIKEEDCERMKTDVSDKEAKKQIMEFAETSGKKVFSICGLVSKLGLPSEQIIRILNSKGVN